MATQEQFDVVVYGASGYTGRLVAEYMGAKYGPDSGINWAMAGRDLDKLASVRDEIGISKEIPLVAANADDRASIKALVASTKVVLTTVGPFQLYGEVLVAECAAQGKAYVDLCGEPAWMRKMIDAHDATARQSGARIVFSCGFDSIPFDLGVYFLQQHCKATTGKTSSRIRCRVRKMVGKFSGGTAASLQATMASAAKDPSILELLRDPFALTPGFSGPQQPHGMKPMLDEFVGSWVAPFIMAPINTRNVHRTNFLLGHEYGDQFVYDEMVLTGPGEDGRKLAEAMTSANPLGGKNAPKPGEGPTRAERDAGCYDLLFLAEVEGGKVLKASVKGNEDPGYGSTSKMIAESAVCLVLDEVEVPGGITTPAASLGSTLIERLRKNASIAFEIEA